MKSDNFIKISQFAKLGGISRKMLIHYDKMDVLKPQFQDLETKYRYYSVNQIKTLKMIKTLQFLGVSLSDIKKDYIDVSIEEYKENLKREQLIIEKKFLEIQRSKKLIEDQISCVEEVSNLNINNNFKIKKYPKRLLITLPIKNTSMKELAKTLLPLERSISGRGFLLFGELGLMKENFKKKSSPSEFSLGIFTKKDIVVKDSTSFEFKSGEYLSFYKDGAFLKEENIVQLNSYFEENTRHAELWCKDNNYKIESELLIIPVLLPFFKLENKIFEVQIKVSKIK